jgi:TonB-dependent starch-binding outer membrane protein SusC
MRETFLINQQLTKGMKLTAKPASGSLPAHEWQKGFGVKLLRIMKLTTIIILAACLHSSANGVAQNTVTISGKEVSLEFVFNAIKKQTSYRFFFNTNTIQQTSKVTIDVKNAPIEQVMTLALKDQPLTFAIKGRTIFIMKKEEVKSSIQEQPTGDPITVSGKVTDDQGQPLVGANVKVKGSTTGVTTDNQGRFTLNNVDPNVGDIVCGA